MPCLLYLAADHAGFEAKEQIKKFLQAREEITLEDCGTFDNKSCDYPSSTISMCQKIQHGFKASDNIHRIGIAVCGSGIGVSMVANRFAGVRAARCVTEEDARLAKEHNNANVLCLGARVNSIEQMEVMIETWLTTEFAQGRHQQRIALFDDQCFSLETS